MYIRLLYCSYFADDIYIIGWKHEKEDYFPYFSYYLQAETATVISSDINAVFKFHAISSAVVLSTNFNQEAYIFNKGIPANDI